MNQNNISRVIKSVAKLLDCSTTYVTVEFFSSGDGQLRYGNLQPIHGETKYMQNKDFDGTWSIFSFKDWAFEKAFVAWVDKHNFRIESQDRLEVIFKSLGV